MGKECCGQWNTATPFSLLFCHTARERGWREGERAKRRSKLSPQTRNAKKKESLQRTMENDIQQAALSSSSLPLCYRLSLSLALALSRSRSLMFLISPSHRFSIVSLTTEEQNAADNGQRLSHSPLLSPSPSHTHTHTHTHTLSLFFSLSLSLSLSLCVTVTIAT